MYPQFAGTCGRRNAETESSLDEKEKESYEQKEEEKKKRKKAHMIYARVAMHKRDTSKAQSIRAQDCSI